MQYEDLHTFAEKLGIVKKPKPLFTDPVQPFRPFTAQAQQNASSLVEQGRSRTAQVVQNVKTAPTRFGFDQPMTGRPTFTPNPKFADTVFGLAVAENVASTEQYNKPLVSGTQINPYALSKAIATVETYPSWSEEKKYSFSKPSGSKILGRDLGKYQVTEGELKEWSQRFLGMKVTPEQFLNTPEIQDNYMKEKVNFLVSEGITDPGEIIALHAQGMTGWGDPAVRKRKIEQANKNRGNYVNDALQAYNSSYVIQ